MHNPKLPNIQTVLLPTVCMCMHLWGMRKIFVDGIECNEDDWSRFHCCVNILFFLMMFLLVLEFIKYLWKLIGLLSIYHNRSHLGWWLDHVDILAQAKCMRAGNGWCHMAHLARGLTSYMPAWGPQDQVLKTVVLPVRIRVMSPGNWMSLAHVLPQTTTISPMSSVKPMPAPAPHWPYDLKIELEEGTSPLFGPIYSLSQSELKSLWEFLDEHLAMDFSCLSWSLGGTLVLFACKKDGLLWLCVHFCILN